VNIHSLNKEKEKKKKRKETKEKEKTKGKKNRRPNSGKMRYPNPPAATGS
jgi:hypothetical protein